MDLIQRVKSFEEDQEQVYKMSLARPMTAYAYGFEDCRDQALELISEIDSLITDVLIALDHCDKQGVCVWTCQI